MQGTGCSVMPMLRGASMQASDRSRADSARTARIVERIAICATPHGRGRGKAVSRRGMSKTRYYVAAATGEIGLVLGS